jgi:hypothetical protein
VAGRWRLTAFLALILGGLLAFAALSSKARDQVIPPTADNRTTLPVAQSGELFPDVQPAAILRVMITDEASGKRLIWTRAPVGWQATDGNGTTVAVDLAAVARSIQILATLRYNRALEESDVTPFGLSGHGKAEIEFDTEGSVPHRIRIGDNTPVDNLTYVQRNDDPIVYLVPSAPITLVTGALPVASPTP